MPGKAVSGELRGGEQTVLSPPYFAGFRRQILRTFAMHDLMTRIVLREIMNSPQPIKLTNGQTLLVMVKDGRVVEYTWDMGLPHVEFVKRSVGELPEGAWVGTVSKIGGQVVAISSKYFYGYQMPAPEAVTAAVRALFK